MATTPLRYCAAAVPYTVGLFISTGYWFASSTSFANPAVTITRSVANTVSGRRLADAPWFILIQPLGATGATGTMDWLPHKPDQK